MKKNCLESKSLFEVGASQSTEYRGGPQAMLTLLDLHAPKYRPWSCRVCRFELVDIGPVVIPSSLPIGRENKSTPIEHTLNGTPTAHGGDRVDLTIVGSIMNSSQ